MRRRFGLPFLALFPALLLLAGCGDPTRPAPVPVIVISISPNNAGGARVEVPRNGSLEFAAGVTAGAVEWSLDGNLHPETGITPGAGNPGVVTLNVARHEVARELTITARSRHNSAVFSSVTVTLIAPDPDRVISVNIIGGNALVERGTSRRFNADVVVSGDAGDGVEWTVEGQILAPDITPTGITPDGFLTVNLLETGLLLTVTARSVFAPEVYDSVTVTVVNPGDGVESVRINPEFPPPVYRGGELEFTAAVDVSGFIVWDPNIPPDTVIWSVHGNRSSGTVMRNVPAGGLSATLVVADDESASELVVRVVSALDGSRYATATVTLAGAIVTQDIWIVGTMTGWAANFPTGAPMTATVGEAGTLFLWEGDVGTGYTFRFSLTDTTGWTDIWNGHWFAPPNPYASGGVTVSLDDNLNTMVRFETDTSPGATHATRNSWRIPHAGWYRLTVNPYSEPPTLRVERPVEVTGVAVTGPTVAAHGSADSVFTATVTGRNAPAQTVTWNVFGAAAFGTGIDADGVLTVAADETVGELTVRATSTVDDSRFGEATVRVTDIPPLPAATNILLDDYGMARWFWAPPSLEGYLSEFRLRLYRAETDAGPFTPAGAPVTVSPPAREHDLSGAMRAAGVGTYRFTVTVVSGDTDAFLDSEPSVPSGTRNVTRRLGVPNVWWVESGIARWVNPDGSGDYYFELFRYGNPVPVFSREVARVNLQNPGGPANQTVTTFDVAWAQASASVDGRYTFTVTALRNGALVLDAEPSGSPAPRDLNVMGHMGAYGTGLPARVWTMTEAGGRFLAGAANGRIARSTDGVTWTLASQGDSPTAVFGNNAVRGFAYGSGRFVAVGHAGRIAFSDDGGETWAAVESSAFGSTYILSVAYGNGMFVAGGDGGNVRHWSRTAAGSTWSGSGVTIMPGTARAIMAVLFDGSRFVAFNARHGAHAGSVNGITWTDIAPNINGTNRLVVGGAFGNGIFVVGVGEYHVWTPRGTFNAAGNSFNWEWSESHIVSRTNPAWSMMEGVSFGNDRFVVFGRHRRLSVSDDDGETWTRVSLADTGIGVYDAITAVIPLSGGRIVLAGDNGRLALITHP